MYVSILTPNEGHCQYIEELTPSPRSSEGASVFPAQAVPYGSSSHIKSPLGFLGSTLQLPTGRSKLLHNLCPRQQPLDQRPSSHCTSSTAGTGDTCTSDICFLVLQWASLLMAGTVLLATEQEPAAIPRAWGIPFHSFTRAPEYYIEIKTIFCSCENKERICSQVSITTSPLGILSGGGEGNYSLYFGPFFLRMDDWV